MHVKELLVRYMDLQRPNSRAGACTKKPAGGSMETHQDPTVRCMQANMLSLNGLKRADIYEYTHKDSSKQQWQQSYSRVSQYVSNF